MIIVESKQGLDLHLATDAEHRKHCSAVTYTSAKGREYYCATAAMFAVCHQGRTKVETLLCRQHARGCGWLLGLADQPTELVGGEGQGTTHGKTWS